MTRVNWRFFQQTSETRHKLLQLMCSRILSCLLSRTEKGANYFSEVLRDKAVYGSNLKRLLQLKLNLAWEKGHLNFYFKDNYI